MGKRYVRMPKERKVKPSYCGSVPAQKTRGQAQSKDK
jgi:hypothetical protein